MLSRHAENLFWIGRYIERAEDTARLLDVTYHTVLEASTERAPDELWAELLETLFLEDEVIPADAGGEIGRMLISDREHRGSIPSIVARARENARTTREWLSVEVWESVNGLHLDLTRTDLEELAAEQPYEVLRRVKAGCQALFGAVDASMPRGEGYRFLVIGQRLERALITARVLGVWRRRLGDFGSQAAFAEWVKLLKSVSAYEAYLRSFRASMEGSQVLVFLLQAIDFPRSVLHCLGLAERLLSEIDAGGSSAGLRRTVGRIRSDVEYVDPMSLSDDIGVFLEGLEEGLLEVAASIDRVYFRPAKALYMHSYEAF